jgi:hypothetical protein
MAGGFDSDDQRKAFFGKLASGTLKARKAAARRKPVSRVLADVGSGSTDPVDAAQELAGRVARGRYSKAMKSRATTLLHDVATKTSNPVDAVQELATRITLRTSKSLWSRRSK